MTSYLNWFLSISIFSVLTAAYFMPGFFGTARRFMTTMATEYAAGTHSMAFVTVPNIDVAKKIAGGLVKNKLAACVNVIPGVTSIYEWEGKLEEDNELILMIKTRTNRVTEVSDWVRSNHPYDVCEVISSPIENGNPPYLKWLGETVPHESDYIANDKSKPAT